MGGTRHGDVNRVGLTHQRQRGLVQELLPGLPHKVEGAGEADGGDLTLDVLGGGGDDVGLDGQRAARDVLAHLPQAAEVVGMDG